MKITKFLQDPRVVLTIASIIFAFIIFYINVTYFSHIYQVFGMLNFIAIFLALGIPFYIKYSTTRKIREIEEMFPNFLRDVTANIGTGMTLPQAIRATKDNDYKSLSKYVKEISAKLDWGIDFEKVLNDFAEKSNSSIIKRSVKTIIETHRSGGKVSSVLDAISESQQMIERIRKERQASVYSQILNGYIIYFVFIGVMIALSRFLIPALGGAEATGEFGKIFKEMFRNLLIIQGIFSGLAIGKMAEGSVFAGFKHSLVLVTVAYTALLLF
ncbi:MAG: type II secretion system F family protein [Candidatus Aenigmatarchaeota archaeon]|nr:type II secretion system F family protein [Candidatus Aenigmarchaeota archaeon]